MECETRWECTLPVAAPSYKLYVTIPIHWSISTVSGPIPQSNQGGSVGCEAPFARDDRGGSTEEPDAPCGPVQRIPTHR